MNPISIRYAFYTLAFTVAWTLFQHYAGYNSTDMDIGQYTRFVPMLVFYVFIFLVIVFQRKENGSSITFKEGFATAFQYSLIFCIGFTAVIAFYQHFVNPGFYDSLKSFTLETLHINNATPGEIEASMKEIEMSFNGSALSFLLLFVFSFAWSTALSAIAALILKRK